MDRMIFFLLLPSLSLAGPLTPEENARLQRACGRTFQSFTSKSVNTNNATRFEAPFAVAIRSNTTSYNSNNLAYLLLTKVIQFFKKAGPVVLAL